MKVTAPVVPASRVRAEFPSSAPPKEIPGVAVVVMVVAVADSAVGTALAMLKEAALTLFSRFTALAAETVITPRGVVFPTRPLKVTAALPALTIKAKFPSIVESKLISPPVTPIVFTEKASWSVTGAFNVTR